MCAAAWLPGAYDNLHHDDDSATPSASAVVSAAVGLRWPADHHDNDEPPTTPTPAAEVPTAARVRSTAATTASASSAEVSASVRVQAADYDDYLHYDYDVDNCCSSHVDGAAEVSAAVGVQAAYHDDYFLYYYDVFYEFHYYDYNASAAAFMSAAMGVSAAVHHDDYSHSFYDVDRFRGSSGAYDDAAAGPTG